MSEERLQEIKDSVNFQREILKAHNMETLCIDEEQELIEEIERLNSIINKAVEYIEYMQNVSENKNIYVSVYDLVKLLKGE